MVVVIGIVVMVIFDLLFYKGLLFGVIVGLIDVVVVFFVLCNVGICIFLKIKFILELESVLNDLMVIFFIIGFIMFI